MQRRWRLFWEARSCYWHCQHHLAEHPTAQYRKYLEAVGLLKEGMSERRSITDFWQWWAPVAALGRSAQSLVSTATALQRLRAQQGSCRHDALAHGLTSQASSGAAAALDAAFRAPADPQTRGWLGPGAASRLGGCSHSFPTPASFTAQRAELHCGQTLFPLGVFHFFLIYQVVLFSNQWEDTWLGQLLGLWPLVMSKAMDSWDFTFRCFPVIKLAVIKWQPSLQCLLLFLQSVSVLWNWRLWD